MFPQKICDYLCITHIIITVLVPTAPPVGLLVTAPARQTLEVKWKPPPRNTWNSDSVKYEFLIYPKGQDRKKITSDQYYVLTNNIVTTYKASGLQMYTMYNITMRMFNEKGRGPWSKSIFHRTSEDCKNCFFSVLFFFCFVFFGQSISFIFNNVVHQNI